MKRSEIFAAAHKAAKQNRINFDSYRASFSVALKEQYQKINNPVTIIKAGYDKQGMTYAQYQYLIDLGVRFLGFRSTTKAMQSMSKYEASGLIHRAKHNEKIEIVY